MQLTKKQELGLEIAVARYKAHRPWTCIAGYAGTGKSTLVKFIVSALGIDPDSVAYVAFTGKAANVLSKKGNPNATTAHKLLYFAKPLPNGKFAFNPKPSFEIQQYSLIVVDEISMLPKNMWNLLLSHRVPIIACGDPAQLPPINPDQDNHVLDEPHIFLDEIMRQAEGNEIIQLSMHIREGKPIETFQSKNKQVQVISKNDIVGGMYSWADQIICSTNRTRNDINAAVRAMNDFGATPQEGDKVICMRNHWDTLTDNYSSLTNGTTGILQNIYVDYYKVPFNIHPSCKIKVLFADVEVEGEGVFRELPIDYNALVKGEKTLTGSQEYAMTKNKRLPEPPYEFAYGYAITGHKSQGSEWDSVLALEERFPFDEEEHRRWLYTVCTRASEKLVVVKK